MGNYLNPGNSGFMQDSQSPIYVDKTGLIGILNGMLGTAKNCVALSHARRFGKSQAARMIDAYYSCGCDSREIFAPFEIAKDPGFETYLNKYNVIHIDVSSAAKGDVAHILEDIMKRLRLDFSEELDDQVCMDQGISQILFEIAKLTERQFVIIIDEWDFVIRKCPDRPELVHRYMQFLHDLFKSEESRTFLALGYITGILPIKKIEDESALNNFSEYTMLNSRNLTPYFGFTEAEVQALCAQYDMEYDSIRKWYNGYLISGRHMYNPNSVYEAMVNQSLESYWKNTSDFGTINRYITLNFDGLRDDVVNLLSGEPSWLTPKVSQTISVSSIQKMML